MSHTNRFRRALALAGAALTLGGAAAAVPSAAEAQYSTRPGGGSTTAFRADLSIAYAWVDGDTTYVRVDNKGTIGSRASWTAVNFDDGTQWLYTPAIAAGDSFHGTVATGASFDDGLACADAWSNYVAEYDERDNCTPISLFVG